MAIKRYIANADTTITSAYKNDLNTRGTGSNMGVADVLEVFSIYGQASGSTTGLSQELARVLLKFPIENIISDRTSGKIPKLGDVNFYLRVFNAEHGETLPRSFVLSASAVIQDWEEGTGLDMVEYSDETYQGPGANWIYAQEDTAWTRHGGDYHYRTHDQVSTFDVNFQKGTEDIEHDITSLVEQWVDLSKPNYGIGLQLSGTQEAYYAKDETGGVLKNESGSLRSYYTKKFFARSSEFFFKRPMIEARWDSANKDDRGNFYYSSSLAPGPDNLNTLYLYNYVRGQLVDIPGIETTGTISVALFSGSADDTAPSGSALQLPIGGNVPYDLEYFASGGWYATGIYTASLAKTSSASSVSTLYDVWCMGGDEFANEPLQMQYHTGTISPSSLDSSNINPDKKHVVNISNLRSSYSNKENARFRLFVREKNWNPNIYTRAVAAPQNSLIDSASYKIFRLVDNYEAIPYGTGSDLHTQLSFDISGNYFDLDMAVLEADFAYGIKFSFYNGAIGDWIEQPYVFKFRVEE